MKSRGSVDHVLSADDDTVVSKIHNSEDNDVK